MSKLPKRTNDRDSRCCWQPIDQWLREVDRRRDPHGWLTTIGYRQNWRHAQPKIEDIT